MEGTWWGGGRRWEGMWRGRDEVGGDMMGEG